MGTLVQVLFLDKFLNISGLISSADVMEDQTVHWTLMVTMTKSECGWPGFCGYALTHQSVFIPATAGE